MDIKYEQHLTVDLKGDPTVQEIDDAITAFRQEAFRRFGDGYIEAVYLFGKPNPNPVSGMYSTVDFPVIRFEAKPDGQ